jgi:hypothetical protein
MNELLEMFREAEVKLNDWRASCERLNNWDFETVCYFVDCHGVAIKSMVSDVWRIFE